MKDLKAQDLKHLVNPDCIPKWTEE